MLWWKGTNYLYFLKFHMERGFQELLFLKDRTSSQKHPSFFHHFSIIFSSPPRKIYSLTNSVKILAKTFGISALCNLRKIVQKLSENPGPHRMSRSDVLVTILHGEQGLDRVHGEQGLDRVHSLLDFLGFVKDGEDGTALVSGRSFPRKEKKRGSGMDINNIAIFSFPVSP